MEKHTTSVRLEGESGSSSDLKPRNFFFDNSGLSKKGEPWLLESGQGEIKRGLAGVRPGGRGLLCGVTSSGTVIEFRRGVCKYGWNRGSFVVLGVNACDFLIPEGFDGGGITDRE